MTIKHEKFPSRQRVNAQMLSMWHCVFCLSGLSYDVMYVSVIKCHGHALIEDLTRGIISYEIY